MSNNAGEPRGAERRQAERYAVLIETQVTDLGTYATINAQCTNISISGCYITTANPNPAGTSIRLSMKQGSTVLECTARVAYSVWTEGMGVAFAGSLAPEKIGILKGWIAEAAAAAPRQPSASGVSTAR
jgi:PilZ domain-containing protein